MKLTTNSSFYLLLVFFCIWIGIGIFPLVTYESDAMHIIAGANLLCENGFSLPPVYCYRYDMQPLSVIMIAGMHRVIPWLTCEQWYCLLTAIAAYVVIFMSMHFVRKLTGCSNLMALLTLVFFPESYAIAMYPNTSIFALAFFLVAMNLIIEGRNLLPLVLMCIAPLMREEIIAVYPVILFLFLWRKDSFKRSILLSAMYAIVVVGVCLSFYWKLNAMPTGTMDTYQYIQPRLVEKVKFTIYTFYTIVNFILIPIGIWICARKQQWLLLLISLVPMVLVHYIYRYYAGATKHWLYLLPFVMVLAVYGWQFIIDLCKRYRAIGITVILLFAVYLTVSVKIDVKDYPWYDHPESVANCQPSITLKSFEVAGHQLKLGLGAGQLIPTTDEYMLLTGGIVYPFYIHNYKCRVRKELEDAVAALKDYDSFNLAMFSWGDNWYLPNYLVTHGWKVVLHDKTKDNVNLYSSFTKGSKCINAFSKGEIDHFDIEGMEMRIDKWKHSPAPLVLVVNEEKILYIANVLYEQGKLKKLSKICFEVI